MASFHAVNPPSTFPQARPGKAVEFAARDITPTTPRPVSQPLETPPRIDESSSLTPTRSTFTGGISSQRGIHDTSSSRSLLIQPDGSNKRKSLSAITSSISSSIQARSMRDPAMQGDSDDGEDASEDESLAGDLSKSSKRKKGQRFFCTEYPPCVLSFTRSEHLARHIRKHTGERPFQCHCSRKFSRLDNLRQHAQTVHVNEEIPGDSLAATGARFQRQVRPHPIRPAGLNRSRASTVGSQSSHGRGHSRNLSTSSIGSTASNFSQRDEIRHRPPPLIMAAGDASSSRARMAMDAFPDSPAHRDLPFRGYINQSSSGFTTPAPPATMPGGARSPIYSSATHSPTPSALSHPASIWESKSGRRLSVPSGANPLQSPRSNPFSQAALSPLPSSTSSTFSSSGSILGSPSISSTHSGRDSTDESWRRRTWHPESYTSLNTRLLNAYHPIRQPVFPPDATGSTRLPGIESFDTAAPTPLFAGAPEHASPGPGHQKEIASWDLSLHQNLTRLDITRRESFSTPQHTITPEPTPRLSGGVEASTRRKRQGWYNGPLRRSPEDSSSSEGVPTPSAASEYNPGIVHSNGWVEPEFGPRTDGMPKPDGENDMLRLDTLVAVATSEAA
ncbi:MAG: hypothetical protein M1829_006810 [Trizodia sp. TS-e1964]|nr:MAG: hypothetical protein M1829_006810 [Trizodia sp. TS-e1964]